eukprot:5092706-Prymnesium_polylepis.1
MPTIGVRKFPTLMVEKLESIPSSLSIRVRSNTKESSAPGSTKSVEDGKSRSHTRSSQASLIQDIEERGLSFNNNV